MSQTFTSVDDRVLCQTIAQARQRLVFAAPGVRPSVAQALAHAMAVIPIADIHIVLDVASEICRLGYGDLDFTAMESLQQAAAKAGLTINHQPQVSNCLLA